GRRAGPPARTARPESGRGRPCAPRRRRSGARHRERGRIPSSATVERSPLRDYNGSYRISQVHQQHRGINSMSAIFGSLQRTIIAGVVLIILIVIIVGALSGTMVKVDHAWGIFFMRWLHILSGVMWIGLLWYFNFVQTPMMPKITPPESRSAINK